MTLYFISDMPGSLGKTDIFKVSIEEGGYGEPVNLGDKINSSAKEFSPYIDGDVIYFSSDRAGGFGKLDVYASKTDGSVFEPVLLAQPINSSADDFAFIINPNSRTGFFSSNRSGGKGDDDIYSFIEIKPVEFKCSQMITGIVRDKNTNEILNDANIVLRDSTGNDLQNLTVKNDGTFELHVLCETPYTLVGEK
jgi:Tol biopolymer transport system component